MRTGSLAVRNAPGSVAQSAVGTALSREKEEEGGRETKKTMTRMRIRSGIRRQMTREQEREKGKYK